jgi:hypothetical protein
MNPLMSEENWNAGKTKSSAQSNRRSKRTYRNGPGYAKFVPIMALLAPYFETPEAMADWLSDFYDLLTPDFFGSQAGMLSRNQWDARWRQLTTAFADCNIWE